MSIESKILSDKAQPLGNYPHIKRVGDFIYVSGTSSRKPDNSHSGAIQNENGEWSLDIGLQTTAVIENIQSLLQSLGADLNHIIDNTVYIVDMKDFPTYNEVYGRFFDHTGPTRTTVAVHQLPHPNLLIEIKSIAYLPIT